MSWIIAIFVAGLIVIGIGDFIYVGLVYSYYEKMRNYIFHIHPIR